jgi:uncharacterized protein YndB with AHSA1/START domain
VIEVDESIVIDAPVEAVFAYLDQPENQPEFTPSLTRSETVETLPNGGKRVAYTYTMAGVDLDGHVEAVEYEPESHVRWEMTGDLRGRIDWTFEPVDGGTRFTYEAGYELPNRVLEAVAGPFVGRYNERELRTALENLRTRLESTDGE